MKFEDIYIGYKYKTEKFIDSKFVESFAVLTGDNNPIHLDKEFAQASFFQKRIIHGMIVGSIFSKTIACDFPGPGSIYIHQELNFLKPIYHNSNLEILFKVLKIKPEKRILEIETNCKVADEIVVTGKAIVKCL